MRFRVYLFESSIPNEPVPLLMVLTVVGVWWMNPISRFWDSCGWGVESEGRFPTGRASAVKAEALRAWLIEPPFAALNGRGRGWGRC